MTPKSKWKASLSNGETFYEDKGVYAFVLGEKSPWQKLLLYIKDNNLQITSLGIYTDDNRAFNLPSSGNNPKFSIFSQHAKPISFTMFKASAISVSGPNDEENFIVVEANYEDGNLQMWVPLYNPDNCWCIFTKKKES